MPSRTARRLRESARFGKRRRTAIDTPAQRLPSSSINLTGNARCSLVPMPQRSRSQSVGWRQTVKVDVTVGLTNADAVLLALLRTVTLKRLLCLRKHHANTTDFLVGKAPYLFGCGSQLWLLQNRRRTGGSTVRDAPEVVCQGVRLGTGPRHYLYRAGSHP